MDAVWHSLPIAEVFDVGYTPTRWPCLHQIRWVRGGTRSRFRKNGLQTMTIERSASG